MTINSKINCNNCIAKVSSDLNALMGEENWSVDIALPNKPLTFSDDISLDDVLDILDQHNMIVE
ncbi:MAG TPA: hypothetical protein DHU80_00715 [Cryomorphaceae bacterium]|nr:hypothetical protein [Cryomorphaceae bacterium]HBB80360.1 hypothetical protein [Cryomorphaceae bacterium]HCY24728.1 hypothetical protein [Cryomorphaceae bacterium]|tara:strand:- start:4851 stop:5042 length:192 start_codon:yes stop_codon:yes gene_type:complete